MKRTVKSLIFSIIFIIIGIVGLFFYIFPLAVRGNVNVGTVAGVMIFGLLLIYGIFKPCVDRWVTGMWKKKIGKIILSLVMLCVVSILVLTGILTYFMVSAATSKPENNTTVVVLGCAVLPSGRPSLMLRERLDAAYDYLMENPDTPCIVCGGQGSDEVMSEAQCMYNYLVEKGIAADRIYMEDKSTSTRENIEFAEKIIKENKLPETISIVTNEFHEYRAQKVAEKLELESYAIAGKTAWWLLPTYYVRELFGIMYEWIL
ncbi:MAG: YdcF family protein [Coprococcus sp.]